MRQYAKGLERAVHFDTPLESGNDSGEIMRDRCNRTCGVHVVGRDLSQVREEIERRGGVDAQIDRTVRVLERGGER